jgi:dipeptide/tripeptide permease
VTTLSRRRNALLFVQLAERSAHLALGFLLMMHLSQTSRLSVAETTWRFAILGFGAIVTPFLGGIVADRWLGYRRAVLGGAALIVVALGLLSLDRPPTLVLGLVVLVLGQGLFHNSVPVLLGELRAPTDARRELDFLLFGFIPAFGLIVPVGVGWLSGAIHWSGTMLILAVFVGAGALVVAWAYPAEPPHVQIPMVGPSPKVKRARIALLVALALALKLHLQGLPRLLLYFTEPHIERLDVSSQVKLHVAFYLVGFFLPLILLGVFAVLRARGRQRLVSDKMGIGMLLSTASFAILLLGALLDGETGPASVPWLLLANLVSMLGIWLMLSVLLSFAVQNISPRWKATLLWFFFADRSASGIFNGERIALTQWPSVPGLSLLVALSLGAALLWRSQGRKLVKKSRDTHIKLAPAQVVTEGSTG